MLRKVINLKEGLKLTCGARARSVVSYRGRPFVRNTGGGKGKPEVAMPGKSGILDDGSRGTGGRAEESCGEPVGIASRERARRSRPRMTSQWTGAWAHRRSDAGC